MCKYNIINIKKMYGEKIVLNNITFEIEDGDFIVIAGPSGCGKSTLLKIIAGFINSDGGDIIKHGASIRNTKVSDRNISMVFQEAALFDHMSVYENIIYGLKYSGVSKYECKKRAYNFMKMLHIGKLANQQAETLSGGEKQRVSIARALVRNPDIFLLDEPFSALDTRLKSELRGELKQLHQQMKKTYVYVTHDQQEAMMLATKLIILNEGKIQQIGVPQELYRKPNNLFVANFLGKYQLNTIEGRINNKKILHKERVVANTAQEKESSCIIGFREHDIIFDEDGMLGEIVLIDDLGNERYYHVYVYEYEKRFVVKGLLYDNKKIGQKVYLKFQWEYALYFDKDNQGCII